MSKPSHTGPTQGIHGEVIPSYVLKRGATQAYSANGAMVRGVVVATYVDDEPDDATADPFGVYCDVLAYSGLYGNQSFLIRKAIVRQERSGLHDGDIWKPRAAKIDMERGTMDINQAKPADMDGDHVIVGFLDQDINLPVVLGCIRHPRADKGKSDSDQLGKRLRLVDGDGDPRLWRHHGGFFGFEDNGDFIVDLTKTANNDYNPDGTQPTAAPASAGAFRVKAREGGVISIQGAEGTGAEISIEATGLVSIIGEGGDTQIIMEPSGVITLSNTNGAQLALKANGDVELNAATAGLGDVKINGTTVAVGTGAIHPAVLGDIWRINEGNLNNLSMIPFWSLVIPFLSTLALQLQNAPPTGTGAASFSALQGAMDAFSKALVPIVSPPFNPALALTTYEGVATAQLSLNVTVL